LSKRVCELKIEISLVYQFNLFYNRCNKQSVTSTPKKGKTFSPYVLYYNKFYALKKAVTIINIHHSERSTKKLYLITNPTQGIFFAE